MKQSFLNKINLCNKCNKAFVINDEGDDAMCDSCIYEIVSSDRLPDVIVGDCV